MSVGALDGMGEREREGGREGAESPFASSLPFTDDKQRARGFGGDAARRRSQRRQVRGEGRRRKEEG